MKDINFKLIIILFIILLINISVSVQSTLITSRQTNFTDWALLTADDEPYIQKISLDPGTVQLNGISLYIDKQSDDYLYVGILEGPLPDPDDIDLTTDLLTVVGIYPPGTTGWHYYDFTGWDLPSYLPPYANVSDDGDYYIWIQPFDFSPYGDTFNLLVSNSTSVGGIPSAWRLKRNNGANSWEDYKWSPADPEYYNLTYKLYGKRFNVTHGSIITTTTTNAWFSINANHIANETTEAGFWLGDEPVSQLSFDYNLTTATPGFSNISTTGTKYFYARYEEPYLTPATYYYVKFWAKNSFGFIEAPGNLTFLTKPNKPTGFSASVNETNVTFDWTNAAAPVTTTRNTVLVASETNYPQWDGSGWTHSGEEVYNGTAETTNVFFDAYSTYYISAYTYITASGSPTYWWYSDLFSFTSFETTGSVINVTARWECNNTIVNLSAGNYYAIAETSTGEILNETVIDSADGKFNISTDTRPNKISIITNSTGGEINHDSIVVTVLTNPGVDNMTMYIPCGEVGILYGDVSRVHIYFVDYTGAFKTENEAIGYIYRYNGTEIEYVHIDFIQADLALRPQLTIGNTYYIGVGCSEFNIPNLGRLTISQANEEFSIEIKYSTDPQVQWHYISNISSGWVFDTLYFDCEDNSHTPTAGTENATLSLYYTNNTLIETTYMEPAWNFNYTRAGLNNTLYYKIRLTIFYNTTTYTWTESFWYTVGPSEYDTIISDPDDIDNPFLDIFGLSPVRISSTEAVAWSSLIALVIASFVLFTFSQKYAGLSIMGVGITLAMFKAPLGLITDDVLNWTVVMMLIILGIFTIFVFKQRR